MYKIFKAILIIIWILDILNIPCMSFLDTTVPINTLAWFLIWIFVLQKRGNLMTNEKRFEKYIKEHCKNCKNRKTNLCDIRIAAIENVIRTKCDYYEREN